MKEKNEVFSDAVVMCETQKEQVVSNDFTQLYNTYYVKVLNKCHSYVRNRKVAEELTEDIFSKIFEKMDGFKQISSFSTWMYAITNNHCIDYLRGVKKMKLQKYLNDACLAEIIDDSDEEQSDIDFDKLMIVLEQIPAGDKNILFMKYHDNKSIREISERIGVREEAVKMRLKRARSKAFDLYGEIFRMQ